MGIKIPKIMSPHAPSVLSILPIWSKEGRVRKGNYSELKGIYPVFPIATPLALNV